MKSFKIGEIQMEILQRKGADRTSGFVNSQMIVNGMDVNRPHRLIHDRANRVWVVEQEEIDENSPVQGQTEQAV